MRRLLAPVVAGIAVLLIGSVSSAAARPAVCKPRAQGAVAKYLGLKVDAVSYRESVASNGMPQCAFAARAHTHKVVVTVNVDNGPQAYFRLMRTVVEASQIFGPPPPGFHPPQGVSGLGPYASWFPNNRQLMATNDVDLLTVTVAWPGADRDTEVAIAKTAIKPYMAKVPGKGSTHVSP
jgi:hypothetical protein